MRGMTRYYHEQFFADVRNTTILVFGLLIIGWAGIEEAFLLVPVAALLGGNQTAFDASYLHFARHYAATLESDLNEGVREKLLVGADLEDTYLYPLNKRKLVTAHLGSGFSWFGWMTLLYTLTGALAFGAGIALGWPVLVTAGNGWQVFYLAAIGGIATASLVIGRWWFVSGVGERRLREVLDTEFGQTTNNSSHVTRS
jgi:hypothetical protein